jgi:hypothetical protein
MSLLAAAFNQPEKNKLLQYLLENYGTDMLNSLEKVQILKYNLRYMNPSQVSFSYELNGQKTTKSLKGQEVFQLTLLPEDLAKIKFSGVQGQVGIVSTYNKPYSAAEMPDQEGLKITRSYLVGKKATMALQRGDLVEVALTYEVGDKAPGGEYEIVDILPAGLRYLERPYNRGEVDYIRLSYPSEVKGQKLVFGVGKGKGALKYYARVISPGEFSAEPTLLSNVKASKIGILGTKNRIIIK